MGKNVFIVYSHQEPTSFNHALLEAAEKGLKKAGHNVKVSDLYAMKWNPVLGRHDITGKSKEEVFEYTMESAMAAEEGRMAADIKAEHDKIKWADLIIFQFPLHWNAFPAMLKGYIDRVFTENFVFQFPDHVLDEGLMKGKKAMLSCTVGIPYGWYTNSAAHGDIETSLFPIQNGLLRFCGFDVLYPELKFGPLLITQEERVQMLADWEKRCGGLFDEKPIEFPLYKDFYSPSGDPLMTYQLKPEIVEQHRWQGLNPGHHLGKAFPKGTMCKHPANN